MEGYNEYEIPQKGALLFMKNAFQKMILVLLAMAMLAGIYTIAFAEDTVQPENESIYVYLQGNGDIYYGDEVTLGVLVENVEGNYTITWQAKVAEDRWEDVEVGMTYKFILTPENASLEYRAVLTVIE